MSWGAHSSAVTAFTSARISGFMHLRRTSKPPLLQDAYHARIMHFMNCGTHMRSLEHTQAITRKHHFHHVGGKFSISLFFTHTHTHAKHTLKAERASWGSLYSTRARACEGGRTRRANGPQRENMACNSSSLWVMRTRSISISQQKNIEAR
eukprot:852734-Pelagomonas_calceolata.AAC.4